MTPHHLHATTAAWSLRAARTRLTDLAIAERITNGQQLLAAGPISSPVYGIRRSTGDHPDPTGGTLTATPVRETRWADLAQRLDQRLTWIADRLAPGTINPLTRIHDHIPAMLPATAATVAKHLADEDTWVRQALHLDPAEQHLPGVPCPRCGTRQLYIQTAAPTHHQTVICRAACVCTGTGCPCGMPGAVEGVGHIWPRTVVLTVAEREAEQ